MSRTRRRALVAGVTLLLVVGVPLLVNRTSVQPGAALVKLAFSRGALVEPPPGFAAIKARVTVKRDIAVDVPGAPKAVLDVYTPTGEAQKPVVLWVHGGGFLSGDRTQVADYATVLADRGFVASLEYSLAPGHHYPVPVRQGTAALSYLAAHASTLNGDAKKLFVGGDSAGAQIASQVATGNKQIKGVILFCGLYDMRTVGATNFPALRTYLWAYTGVRDYTEYPDIDQLSTTEHITADYPPTYLTVGDKDPFEPQAKELEDVLRKHHIAVTTRYWQHENLGHEYQFDLRTQPAETVLTDTVAFLNGHSR